MYLLSGAWTKENDFNQLVTALTDTKLVEEFDFDVYEKNIKDLINIFYLMVIQYFLWFFLK